jgi:CheY-like chemotaxis protein
MSGADLVIHDAQYTPEEYLSKKNWGHSHYEYVVEIAAAAGVRRVALTHHDPLHDDAFLTELEEQARAVAARRGSGPEVFCAYEGCEVVLQGTAAHQDTEAAAAVPNPPPGHAARILVADDDPLIRRLAVRTLMREGHTVAEAVDGLDVLRIVQTQAFDLLVLDLDMPGMTGLEVLHALRHQEIARHMPVLILTAADDEHSTCAGFAAGANDYLTKPFVVPQLVARVYACLARTG